ncbi:MAG: hypothetical protein EAZ95_15305, partial [Bacteroidetes bacterium]
MKNRLYYFFWASALIVCLACCYAIARKQYFQRADRYKKLYHLENYVEMQYEKNERTFVEILKAIDRKGTTAQHEPILQETQALKKQVGIIYMMLKKVGKKLPEYARCNVLAEDALIVALQDFEN